MIKKLFRASLRQLLGLFTKIAIKKHNINIIAITGSGKTSLAKEVSYNLLHSKYPGRRNVETPDTEFYIPLTILGFLYYPQNLIKWLALILETMLKLAVIKPHKHFIVLEMTFINDSIFNFWIKILNPDLILIIGEVENSKKFNMVKKIIKVEDSKLFKTNDFLDLAFKIGKIYNIRSDKVKKILENTEFPKPRIGIIKKGDITIVDSTYIYRPPPLKSVLEMFNDISLNKYILSDFKDDFKKPLIKKLGWARITNLNSVLRGVVIIRTHRFNNSINRWI